MSINRSRSRGQSRKRSSTLACNEKDIQFYESMGYRDIKAVPLHGYVGISPMLFTWGLFCDLSRDSYSYRYCYHTLLEAYTALQLWTDEVEPPLNWIVRKGLGGDYQNPEYRNPEYRDDSEDSEDSEDRQRL